MDAKVVFDVFHLNYWDWRIACDLFFGGLGVGAYLFSVFVSWYYQDRYPQVSKIGAVIAPIGVIIGFGFLLLELGHPLRITNMLFSYHPTSPLWWGGWFQGLFVAISVWHAMLWISDRPEQKDIRKRIGWLGIPFAMVVGAYHGFLMTIVKAHPLWNAGPSTVTAMLGFAITGMAAVVLILSISKKNEQLLSGIRFTRDILGAAIILQIFTIFLWTVSLANGPRASVQALHEMNKHFGVAFWGLAVGVGLALPLVIGVLEIARERRRHLVAVDVKVPLMTSALVLVGAFAFRYIILMAGQTF